MNILGLISQLIGIKTLRLTKFNIKITQRLMQEIIQDRNYFIESNYLRITELFRRIGSWKCPCLQTDIGFSKDVRIVEITYSSSKLSTHECLNLFERRILIQILNA